MTEYFKWHLPGFGPLKKLIKHLLSYEFTLFENIINFSKELQ